MTTSSLSARLWCAAALPIGLLMLAGCADASGETTRSTSASSETAAPVDGTASGSSALVIGCDDVAAVAAPITGAFSFSADDSSEDSSGTTCVWTNAALDAGESNIEDYAALGITVDGTAWSADDLATLAGATDHPRAAALGGRLLLGSDAATLGEAGSVQVLYPEGTVTVVATGTLLGASPDTLIPVDSVVDVAVAVAGLRR
ncbi:hypothetical protein ACL9RL_06070 [Plantibacter sp. Mn2098]|uniref:hypothetical protein n=1 Tax=Plantibacter sp. Mn2098 TaxID=3395266 RepID=UPI003BE0928A